MQQRAVVIIGAGPTGLAAANLLGMAGIETVVIERNADVCEFPRAIAIDDEGLRICQALGLADEMLAHMRLAVKAHYVSARKFLARVAPTAQRNGYPLISTFHQPTFERILLKGIERFPCVNVLFQHTLETFQQDAQNVSLSVRTPDGSRMHLECAYLLACDGGKSSIRHTLGIPMQPPFLGKLGRGARKVTPRPNGTNDFSHKDAGPASGQKWLVVDGISESEPSDTIIFFCNPKRPAVSVPAPGQLRRWEFMLLPGEQAEDLLQSTTIHTFIKQAQRNIPRNYYRNETQPAPPTTLTRQAIYTFQALTARNFSQGRVFLLGDAAHLMPPFGGQGMNSGLRDAQNLCWKLQRVLQGQAHARLLASYEQERRPHVSQMILFSWLLGKVIMPTSHGIALIRDLFFQEINRIPRVREAIREMHVKPVPRYTHGFLLADHGSQQKALTGILLPQPYVLTQENKRVLLDEVLGDGFALLRLHTDPQEAFSELQHDIWKRLAVRFVCVRPASDKSQQGNTMGPLEVIDIDQSFSLFVRGQKDLYVLVRPDRYVMGVFCVGQGKNVAQLLESI